MQGRLLGLVPLLLASCAQVETEEERAEREAQELEARAVAMLQEVLYDPTAILVRNLSRGPKRDGEGAICGEVNGKNRFGGFVGFREFVAYRENGEVVAHVKPEVDRGDPLSNFGERALFAKHYRRHCVESETSSEAVSDDSAAETILKPRSPARPPHPVQPEQPRLSSRGFGDILIGMRIDAPAIQKFGFVDTNDYDGPCRTFSSSRFPDISLMVENGVISTISLYENYDQIPSTRKLQSGIGLGDDRSKVERVYGKLEEESGYDGKVRLFHAVSRGSGIRFDLWDGLVSEIEVGSESIRFSEGCS